MIEPSTVSTHHVASESGGPKDFGQQLLPALKKNPSNLKGQSLLSDWLAKNKNETERRWQEALLTVPDCRPLEEGFREWLQNNGDEDRWLRHVECFPDDHRLRERFGMRLAELGDPRGRGYQAMGALCICARKGRERKPSEFWEVTHSGSWFYYKNDDNRHSKTQRFVLPLDWFRKVPLHAHVREGNAWKSRLWESDEGKDNSSWRHDVSQQRLHDRVALAFNDLPPERQTALLRGEFSEEDRRDARERVSVLDTVKNRPAN